MKANKPSCAAILATALWLSAAFTARPADFELDWFNLHNEGVSSGGDFELSATVGQPDAGELAGGDFTLTGGFWSVAIQPDPLPVISLSVSLAAGSLSISWPESGSAGFALEEFDTLANSPGNTWTSVNVPPESSNGIKTVRLTLASGKRFYRLHHP